MITKSLYRILPLRVQKQLDAYADTALAVGEMRDPNVLASLAPSALRGTVLKRGKQGIPR